MKVNSSRLISIRKKRGFSQQEIANKCGCPRTTYRDWENTNNISDYLDVLKICKVLNISPEEICLEEIPSINQHNMHGHNIVGHGTNISEKCIDSLSKTIMEELSDLSKIEKSKILSFIVELKEKINK